MIASTLLYVGVGTALLAAVLGVLAHRRRGEPRRARWRRVALAGIALALLALVLPDRAVVVDTPRTQLDAIVPRYHFGERHALAIAADPLAVDRAIREVTADEIRLYGALTWLRRLGGRGPASLLHPPPGVPMLALATRSGFHLLADAPGHEVVLGVTLPVSRSAREADLRARGKRPFRDGVGGYATAVMNFRIVPDGRGGSVLSTETRVAADDPATRRRFGRYWRVIYPGSALIRRSWLAAIRRRAEAGAADVTDGRARRADGDVAPPLGGR